MVNAVPEMQPGQIVLSKFPFSDMAVSKWRPGLVISSADYHAVTGQVWLLMITRAKASAWPNDIMIEEYKSAGLEQPCLVRMKLYTLDYKLLGKTIGQVTPRSLAQARRQCAEIIGADNFG